MNKIYGLDIRSLGLFRLALGITLLIDLFMNKILAYKEIYATATGILGQTYLKTSLHRDLFFGFVHTAAEMPYVFFAAFLSYLCYTTGLFFRITRFTTLVLFVYITHKYGIINMGADGIIITMLVFTLFLPLDNRFCFFNSVKNSIPKETEVRNLAVWGLLLQIGIIYFMNAAYKTGPLWHSGWAVKAAASNTMFSRVSYDFLQHHDKLFMFINYFSYTYEFAFIFLLFFPFRNQQVRVVLPLAMLGFHLILQVFMKVGNFYLVYPCIAMLLVPGIMWDKLNLKQFKGHDNYRLSPIRKFAVLFLIVMIVQENFFQALNLTPLYHTKIYKLLHYPFRPLKYLPDDTPFFIQRWNFFAPDPPEEMGIITVEAEYRDWLPHGDLKTYRKNLSVLDPFKKKNNYKTTTLLPLRLLDSKIRNYSPFILAADSVPLNPKIKELVTIWSEYQLKRINEKDKRNYTKIEAVLYSCKTADYLKNNKLEFKRLKLFDILQ